MGFCSAWCRGSGVGLREHQRDAEDCRSPRFAAGGIKLVKVDDSVYAVINQDMLTRYRVSGWFFSTVMWRYYCLSLDVRGRLG